jgi:hypothetical protein
MLAFTPNQQYNDGMNKTCVILKKEMNLSDGRKVVTIFEVTDDIVTVCVADWEPVPLPWDTIPDVEQLSILFGDHVVSVFKQVVEQLGSIYNNRGLYAALT